VDKYRGYGVRLQFYFQSLGQLKKCFPAGQEQTLLSNTSQVFFGVNDNITADYISARLGEETIIVDSGGSSTGTSNQNTIGAQPTSSDGRSDNSSRNWQQQARKLLKPEEVIALSPRDAITFTPGMRPIFTTLLRYFEEKNLGEEPCWLARSRAACWMLIISAMLCAEALGIAMALTVVMVHEAREQPTASAQFADDQPSIIVDGH
jgi:type IV secretion system protein VirD4